MNFRAEAKTETSIVLSWSPPRQEIIVKYELLYKEGDHGREVSPQRSSTRSWGPEEPRAGRRAGVSGQGSPLLLLCLVLFYFLPPSPTSGAEELRPNDLVHCGRPEAQH